MVIFGFYYTTNLKETVPDLTTLTPYESLYGLGSATATHRAKLKLVFFGRSVSMPFFNVVKPIRVEDPSFRGGYTHKFYNWHCAFYLSTWGLFAHRGQARAPARI